MFESSALSQLLEELRRRCLFDLEVSGRAITKEFKDLLSYMPITIYATPRQTFSGRYTIISFNTIVLVLNALLRLTLHPKTYIAMYFYPELRSDKRVFASYIIENPQDEPVTIYLMSRPVTIDLTKLDVPFYDVDSKLSVLFKRLRYPFPTWKIELETNENGKATLEWYYIRFQRTLSPDSIHKLLAEP